MNTMSRQDRWDLLYGTLQEKRERLDELKAQGRYGYQLRMPKKAIQIAWDALAAEFPEESKGV